VSKVAVEPVWYLPGVAERFDMCVFHHPVNSTQVVLTSSRSSESLLRRAPFEDTGRDIPRVHHASWYQDLPPSHRELHRVYHLSFTPCQTIWLPNPIDMVGNPAFMSDESKELTLRVHDDCSPPILSLSHCDEAKRPIYQITAPTSFGLISAPAGLTSPMQSKNVPAVLRKVRNLHTKTFYP
jgi:hypothetical protein